MIEHSNMRQVFIQLIDKCTTIHGVVLYHLCQILVGGWLVVLNWSGNLLKFNVQIFCFVILNQEIGRYLFFHVNLGQMKISQAVKQARSFPYNTAQSKYMDNFDSMILGVTIHKVIVNATNFLSFYSILFLCLENKKVKVSWTCPLFVGKGRFKFCCLWCEHSAP